MEKINIGELLSDISTLIGRHPYLPMTNISYNRNFVDIMASSEIVSGTHSEITHPKSSMKTDGIMVEFSDTDNLRYDSEKVSGLKDAICGNLNRLREVIDFELESIKDDLIKLREKSICDDSVNIKKSFRSFIIASPFLYNSDAEALYRKIKEHPQNFVYVSDPSEIQSLYNDLFIEHLAPVFITLANTKGLGDLHRITNNVINNFIKKDVHRATLLFSDEDKSSFTKRAISIETIPPCFTSLRGALAGDCSMASIPYYGLHRDAKVFWIRKSKDTDSKPSGYAFVVLVEDKGIKYPYIPTINGPALSTSDVIHTIKAVCEYYNSEYVFLSDPAKASFLVNTQQILDVFMGAEGDLLEINLPEGWETIQNISRENQSYENYYHSEHIKFVKKVKADDLKTHIVRIKDIEEKERYPKTEISGMNLVSRSVIAYYYNKSSIYDGKTDIKKLLNLTDKNIKAVNRLTEIYGQGRMSLSSFNELREEFDMGLESLAELPFNTRAYALRDIYEQYKDEFEKGLWKKIIVRTNREIDKELEEKASYGSYYLDSFKALKASMPDLYIPDYWEKLLPYFFLNGLKEPDYYIINRFVKYFHSIGTIENLLLFIDDYPSLQRLISIYDKRWVSFFERAFKLSGDKDFVKKIIKKLYVLNLKETKIRMSYREIAKAYLAYCSWYSLSIDEFFSLTDFDDDEREGITKEIEVVKGMG